MSLDGYVAGPNQSLADPVGQQGHRLHDWMFPTRFFHAMTDKDGGQVGVDNDQLVQWHKNVGATIMGRNMFGPVRGGWGDSSWTGWWGDEPSYHSAVFVLTHYARDPLVMQGGTTFYFVTEGITVALERAQKAAGGMDVMIAGGAQAVQQYLKAGLIDTFGLHVAPVFLGAGERLFDKLDGGPIGYTCVELVSSSLVAHYRFAREG
jgi:dihydrofolate reductase